MGRDPAATPQSKLAARAATDGDGVRVPAEASSVAGGSPQVERVSLGRILLPFLCRDDGWLRVTPHDNGDVVYWKWKWTRGPNTNRYVMVVYPQSQSADALLKLTAKIDAVDGGIESAVKDHYFQG